MSELKIELSNDNQMIVSDSLESGFAHIVTQDNFVIQCCLVARKDQKGYKKTIDSSDCGATDGICGDVNKKAFEKYGVENCMKKLFSEMKKLGLKIQ